MLKSNQGDTMKRMLFFLCVSLLVAGVAYAAVGAKLAGTYKGEVAKVNAGAGLAASTFDGDTLSLDGSTLAATSGTATGLTGLTVASGATSITGTITLTNS
jgi:hypothetical protein